MSLLSSERKLSKGSRVHLSDLGRSRHRRNSEKKGTIVGQTQYPNSFRIIWDGSRRPVTIHRDYLQPLEKEMPMDDQSPAAKNPTLSPRAERGNCIRPQNQPQADQH
jgi:hypothetical protein